MASSTLFRGRRIVDPVPVQRGPSPRDGKYQSSFSGSTFEWCWNKTRRFILLWLTCISIIGSITSFCFDHCDLFVSVLAVVKAWLQVVVFCNYTFVYIFLFTIWFRFSSSLGKRGRSEVCGKYCNISSLFCLVSISQVVDLVNFLETNLAIRIKITLHISL